MTVYGELPYERFPIPAMHVDRLATIAHLFGVETAPIRRCRVLELGCGSGAHLSPMAAALPESTFVGIDLSEVQIEMAREEAEAIGLSNVHFEAADLCDWPIDAPFDYVIAHGVYSWVPGTVRDRLLARVAEVLSPVGVGAVSYSVLPGAHMRLALRDILRWKDDPSRPPADRVGDVSWFAAQLSSHLDDSAPLTPVLRRMIGQLGGMSDAYVFHDLLAEDNHPVTLTDFVEHARTHGLDYVADANLQAMVPPSLDASARQGLASMASERLGEEQLLDFAVSRSFRTSVLCKAERAVRPLAEADLAGLLVYTEAESRGLENGRHWFRAPGRPRFGVEPALADRLTGGPTPMAELDAPDRQRLLELFQSDQVQFTTVRLEGSGQGFSFARHQVRAGEPSVTNLRHRTVSLDRQQRELLLLLDGRTDHAIHEGFSGTSADLQRVMGELLELALLMKQV